MNAEAPHETARVGLCATCTHHRLVVSGRGSRFHLCELAKRDEGLTRYPVLPVLRCRGYSPAKAGPAEA